MRDNLEENNSRSDNGSADSEDRVGSEAYWDNIDFEMLKLTTSM
jgi:hypothetical protein